MVKAHEKEVKIEKFDDMESGNNFLIAEINKEKPFEKGDFILIHKVNENGRTGDSMMTKVEFVINDDGLKENFVLLKLIKLN